MRKYVSIKLENEYAILPIGNKINKIAFKLNQMGYEILELLFNGVSEADIKEKYISMYPNVNRVEADVSNCITLVKRIFQGNEDSASNNRNNILNEIQNYYFKLKKPYRIFLELTNNCNLRCPHCYMKEFIKSDEKYIEKQKVLKLIDDMEENGVVELTITGGEASMHPDFEEIVRYAASKNMLISILSNGQYFYDRKLYEVFRDVPLEDIRISIYGTSEYHDKFVQTKGAFSKIKVVLKKLREIKGIGTGAYVVTKTNYMYLDEVIKEFAADNVEISFTPTIIPTIKGDKGPTKLRVNREILREIVEKHTKNFKGAMCTAGITRFRITSNGDFNACEQIRDVNFGNIYTSDFQAILNGPKRAEWIKFYENLMENHICTSCNIRSKCHMCPGLFYLENGDFNKPSKFLCEYTVIINEVYEERKEKEV